MLSSRFNTKMCVLFVFKVKCAYMNVCVFHWLCFFLNNYKWLKCLTVCFLENKIEIRLMHKIYIFSFLVDRRCVGVGVCVSVRDVYLYTKLYWLSTARPDSVSMALLRCWFCPDVVVGVLAFDRFVDDVDWFNSKCVSSKSHVLIRVLAFNVIIWFGCMNNKW